MITLFSSYSSYSYSKPPFLIPKRFPSKSPILRSPSVVAGGRRLLPELHANAYKGFGGSSPQTTAKDERKPGPKGGGGGGGGDDDEIPQEVMERMAVRIVVSVGVPLAAGIGMLNVFGEIKEQNMWEVPLWVPFMTTVLLFGTSTLGIAYGALSSSWDVNRRGSALGFKEAQRNWVEMWKDESDS